MCQLLSPQAVQSLGFAIPNTKLTHTRFSQGSHIHRDPLLARIPLHPLASILFQTSPPFAFFDFGSYSSDAFNLLLQKLPSTILQITCDSVFLLIDGTRRLELRRSTPNPQPLRLPSTSPESTKMASRGPPGARGGMNTRFAQFKLVLLGTSWLSLVFIIGRR